MFLDFCIMSLIGNWCLEICLKIVKYIFRYQLFVRFIVQKFESMSIIVFICVQSIFFNCKCFGVVKKFVIVFLVLECFIGLRDLIFVINYFIFFKIFLLF